MRLWWRNRNLHWIFGIGLSFRPVSPYIALAELRGACWISIPGALSISKGAVPGLARGLGHTAPTYVVGSRDRYPTAIAAPRFRWSSRFSPCLSHSPSRPCAHRPWRGAALLPSRPPQPFARASRGRRPRPRQAIAPRDRLGLFSAAWRAFDFAAPRKACRGGSQNRLAGDRAAWHAARFPAMAPWRADGQGKDGDRRAFAGGARGRARSFIRALGCVRSRRPSDRLWRGLLRSHFGGAARPENHLGGWRRLCQPGAARKFRTKRMTSASITCSPSAS